MLGILWISMCAPYDRVAHAGGKIENFYVKGLNKSIPVSMITFANYDEMELVDLDSYNIKAYVTDMSDYVRLFEIILVPMGYKLCI